MILIVCQKIYSYFLLVLPLLFFKIILSHAMQKHLKNADKTFQDATFQTFDHRPR